MSRMGEETNKGHGNPSVMSSLRRVISKKVPPSVLEEMRPMMTSSSSKHSKPPRASRTLDFSLRDKTDATAKRGFRVQVPKRLLVYTIVVFFVFPLLLGVIVGTRRIYRMHFPEQPEVPPSDWWQEEGEQQDFDLQTAAKSGSAVNTTEETTAIQIEPKEPPGDGEEQAAEPVVAGGNGAQGPAKTTETITNEENKQVVEEKTSTEAASVGDAVKKKEADSQKDKAAEITPAQVDNEESVAAISNTTAAETEQAQEKEAEPNKDEKKEATIIDEKVAGPADAAVQQPDAKEGEAAPETNKEQRNRFLRGSQQ